MRHDIENYLQQLLPVQPSSIIEIKKKAQQWNIPIMEETSLHLLTVLIQLYRPKRILELGTGIGYSAIRMALADRKGQIITLEKDQTRFKQAVKTIENYGFNDQISVLKEDALEYLEDHQAEKFDFIYIDAAKNKYRQFFQLATDCLQPKGIIVTDNVLFRGYVVDSTNIPKRFERIVKNLQQFNEWVAKHPKFTTSIVPIGDGISISIKKTK